MSFREFLKRLVFHITLAATAWFVLALALERLIPGFISPFVNLPFFGLCLIAAVCMTVLLHYEGTRLARIWSISVLTLLVIGGGLFVWSRVDAFGLSGIMLMASAAILAGLTIYALTVESS